MNIFLDERAANLVYIRLGEAVHFFALASRDFHSFIRAFQRTPNDKAKTRPVGPYAPRIEFLACKMVVGC